MNKVIYDVFYSLIIASVTYVRRALGIYKEKSRSRILATKRNELIVSIAPRVHSKQIQR
jgi:hypothetical protein